METEAKMTLEDLDYLEDSLPKIPPETCPLIDLVQEGIKNALRLCNGRGAMRYRSDPDSLEDLKSAVESELDGLIEQLEQVRKHNATLRELGREWHKTAKRCAA